VALFAGVPVFHLAQVGPCVLLDWWPISRDANNALYFSTLT